MESLLTIQRDDFTKYVLLSSLVLALVAISAASHGGFEDNSDPSVGSEDAEVTMEVWCDFQGPYCKQFFQETFPQIQSQYLDHGDLRVVFKDNPLDNLHPWSEESATVMECVHRQEDSLYLATAKTIYEDQDSIENDTVREDVVDYAVEEGANESQITNCMDKNPGDEVKSDLEEAEARNISATPTIIIGDQRIEGAQDFTKFEAVINSELGVTENDSESSDGEDVEEGTNESKTDPEDLENRLEDNSSSNVTALKERLQEQEQEIEQIKEKQNTIVSILDSIMNMLGL